MRRHICRHVIKVGCFILLVVCGTWLEVNAQEAGATCSPSPKYQEVTIPNTELRTIRSQNVGQEFNIYVQLPSSYYADSTTTYRVLYVTDANRSFPMVANISSVLGFPKGNFPEIIVVGIGYPVKDMSEWAARRTRDLTPTPDTSTDRYWNNYLAKLSRRKFDVRSGGAPKFLDFITNELIPFIESNYRVSHSDRGLAGYSYGGLFALYVFFAQPRTFSRYFAGSPSVEYNKDVIFKQASGVAATDKGLAARIFLSVGSLEDSSTVAGVKRMSAVLQSRYGPGVQVSSQVFEGENHRSCMAAAMMRAFRVLYGQ